MSSESGFLRITIGLDGSSGGRDALVLFDKLAPTASHVELVTVRVEDPFSAREVGASISAEGERQGALVAAEMNRRHIPADVRVRTTVATSVAAGLTSDARRHDSDLIVVGSSTRGTRASVLLGNDTRELLRHAPCAVAVAPKGLAEHPGGTLSTIGVGYGADAASRRALAVARDLQPAHGTLCVTRVAQASQPPLDPTSAATALLLHRPAAETVRAAGASEDLAGDFAGVDDVLIGSVRGGLLEFAQDIDLLVIGLHDRSPLGRMLHGHTTAESLLRELPCPLLAVPEAHVPVVSVPTG